MMETIQTMRSRKVIVRKVAERCMEILIDHIGLDNAIQKNDLYYKIYGQKHNCNSLSAFYMADVLKRALHELRANTNCFPASTIDKESGNWVVFVLKKKSDEKIYRTVLDDNIARMQLMKEKAARAVQERWWKQKWQFVGGNND